MLQFIEITCIFLLTTYIYTIFTSSTYMVSYINLYSKITQNKILQTKYYRHRYHIINKQKKDKWFHSFYASYMICNMYSIKVFYNKNTNKANFHQYTNNINNI